MVLEVTAKRIPNEVSLNCFSLCSHWRWSPLKNPKGSSWNRFQVGRLYGKEAAKVSGIAQENTSCPLFGLDVSVKMMAKIAGISLLNSYSRVVMEQPKTDALKVSAASSNGWNRHEGQSFRTRSTGSSYRIVGSWIRSDQIIELELAKLDSFGGLEFLPYDCYFLF